MDISFISNFTTTSTTTVAIIKTFNFIGIMLMYDYIIIHLHCLR